ncbi:MAG: hypothetical protein WDO19_20165 [Bacteroidota bacterium]
MSFTDVMQLTRNEIAIGIDGEQWIFTKRTKTNTASRIPLLPVAKDIMQKYASVPEIVNSGRLLPNLSNQKMNSYLKELTDICEIKKELTNKSKIKELGSIGQIIEKPTDALKHHTVLEFLDLKEDALTLSLI